MSFSGFRDGQRRSINDTTNQWIGQDISLTKDVTPLPILD